MSQIPFLVETGRILEILSKQIYDSPYAMVRENVQNAYDAVLMRAKREGKPLAQYSVDITATRSRIEIADTGIGMSEQVLRDNFWRAGSSGKNNEEARAAGVIGTFGIGAMANFGVCERLVVETREIGAAFGIRTSAVKSELSIGTDCIRLERLDQGAAEGTRLTAEIAPTTQVDVSSLKNYILPFVKFLAVPVRLNGELLSGEQPRAAAGIGDAWNVLGTRTQSVSRFSFSTTVMSDRNQIAVIVDDISIDGAPASGGLWLRQQGGQIMGLRSRFGLAPVPIAGVYQLGGYADLPFLLPTAGREALTRECIQEAAQFLPLVELAISEAVKDTPLAESLGAFQQHVLQLGRIAWGARVQVQLSPGDRRVELGKLADDLGLTELYWYPGVDAETIRVFSSEERPLLRVSQQSPRRDLQQRYLKEILKLQPVPDTATIRKTFAPSDLTWSEVTLMLAIARVLKGDYLIDDVRIEWVEISHSVPLLTETTGDQLVLRLSRTWAALQAVLKVLEGSSELLDGLTKDLVRVHIYDKIKNFVPSSQRAGLDALQKTLSRRRELYRLEWDDKGDLEPLLADYLAGKVEFQQVLNVASRAASGQAQRVSNEAVGTVENVLADVVSATVAAGAVEPISVPMPGSPILRLDNEVRERLLTTEREFPQLNNHRVFLALSDRLVQLEREFFTWPHSTQVAWAGRRVVFLFGLAQSGQNLYYDIELKGSRSAGDAGGTAVITTTIVTKNRIFVPIPAQLQECFRVSDGPVEFYVRFDTLGHN